MQPFTLLASQARLRHGCLPAAADNQARPPIGYVQVVGGRDQEIRQRPQAVGQKFLQNSPRIPAAEVDGWLGENLQFF